jgi:hypothetical protein
MPRGRKPSVADMPSTGYGDTAALVASDAAVPSQPGAAQAFIGPDEIPNLSDPTARPGEPVTTGLPFGPGAGPEVMGPAAPDPTREALQSMLLVAPNPDIMRLLDLMDIQGR